MQNLEIIIIANDEKTYIGDGSIIGIAKNGFIVSVYDNHEYKKYYQPYIWGRISFEEVKTRSSPY